MSVYDDDLSGAEDGRNDDLEAAIYNAETDAAAAKELAEKWATECEFMLKRISALEAEVKRLGKLVTNK